MSFLAAPSSGSPNSMNSRAHFVAGAIMRQIQNEIPDFLLQGAVVSRQLMDRAAEIIRRNILALVGSGFAAAGLAALIPSLLVVLVNLVGFTSSGVVAGSLAAALQSAFWGANTGGLFAALQSFGATAAVAPPVAIVLGVTGLVIGAGCLGWWLYTRDRPLTIEGPVDGDDDDDDDSKNVKPDSPDASDSAGKVVAKSTPNPVFNLFDRFRR